MMSASEVSLAFYCVKVDAVWFDFASLGHLVTMRRGFFLFCTRSFLKDKMNTPSWVLYPGSGLFYVQFDKKYVDVKNA